jgi:hypothetical protein
MFYIDVLRRLGGGVVVEQDHGVLLVRTPLGALPTVTA